MEPAKKLAKRSLEDISSSSESEQEEEMVAAEALKPGKTYLIATEQLGIVRIPYNVIQGLYWFDDGWGALSQDDYNTKMIKKAIDTAARSFWRRTRDSKTGKLKNHYLFDKIFFGHNRLTASARVVDQFKKETESDKKKKKKKATKHKHFHQIDAGCKASLKVKVYITEENALERNVTRIFISRWVNIQ
jgi:hypothetical protein